MNVKLKEKVREALTSVLPITIIVLLLSIIIAPMEIGTIAMFLVGALMLIRYYEGDKPKCGLGSEAQGVTITLPVDSVVGI